jgi:ATP-binding cassette, subfamily B, multidrug efflux pump
MQPDFGYMEEGKLGKAYDLKLMARLGVFLKPYGAMIGLTLVLVLLMAAFDLLIPYLTKEAIDRYIVNFSREVVLKGDASQEEKRLLEHYGKNLIPLKEPGKYLLPPDATASMDRREIAVFQKANLLTEERYYLFIPRGKEDEALLKRYPGLLEREGPYAYLRVSQFKNLAREDLLSLRKRDVDGILRITLWMIVILIAHFAINFYQVYLMELAGQRVMHDLRMRLFSHLQNLSVSFFDKNPVGRLVTRLTNDIENIHEMFTSVLVYLFKDVLLLAGIIAFLLYLNREFALVAFSFLPLIFITTLLFSHRARDAFREVRLRIAQMNAFFQENFSGIKVVQLFQREAENGRRFGKINKEHFRANMRQISIFALFVPLIEVLSSGAIGLLIWYGGGKVLQETITLGALVAFIAYMRMFFQPIRDLSEKYTILQSAMASLERVFLLLDREKKVAESASSVRQEMRGQIEFKDVSFSYDGEERVLKEVSFSVEEGETVAIVGATGAGKTSLLHLLERFYDVEDGTILIDGVDIRRWHVSRLRTQIGLVMQDTFLFAGDIEQNIRLGSTGSNEDRVRRVAQIVNAEAFINRLPRGYQTQVGQGGEQLSSGEMQLLAFARALYIDPRVLVLDEATSHVDPETERLVQEGLTRLLKGRTAIIIAHRLSTIQHADRIIVLHKGRVREMGNHAELMARKGFYYRLYQLQFGREE